MRKRRKVGHTFERLNGLFWLETPDNVRDALNVQSSTFSTNSSKKELAKKVSISVPSNYVDRTELHNYRR